MFHELMYDDTTRDLSLTRVSAKALCYLRGCCPRCNDVSLRSVYTGATTFLLYSNSSNILLALEFIVHINILPKFSFLNFAKSDKT